MIVKLKKEDNKIIHKTDNKKEEKPKPQNIEEIKKVSKETNSEKNKNEESIKLTKKDEIKKKEAPKPEKKEEIKKVEPSIPIQKKVEPPKPPKIEEPKKIDPSKFPKFDQIKKKETKSKDKPRLSLPINNFSFLRDALINNIKSREKPAETSNQNSNPSEPIKVIK